MWTGCASGQEVPSGRAPSPFFALEAGEGGRVDGGMNAADQAVKGLERHSVVVNWLLQMLMLRLNYPIGSAYKPEAQIIVMP